MKLQQSHTIGIQVKTMINCVGISLEDQFKISVEYKPIQIQTESPQIYISICPFTKNMPDESAKNLSVINITPKEYQPVELIQLIFKHLKMCASEKSGVEIYNAVYSMPGSFNESERQRVMEAGSRANFQMKYIDEYESSALAFSRINIVQPNETILVFHIREGIMEVALMITTQGQFEMKFRIKKSFIVKNQVPNNLTKIELNKLWEQYGQSMIQRVLDDEYQVNNVVLVANYPNIRMMHLTQLFVELFEKKKLRVNVNINPEWGVAYGAAILASKQSGILQLMTFEVEEIYKRVIILNQQEQIKIIEQLKIESKLLFKEYCLLTNYFKDQEYQTQYNLISSLGQFNKIEKCNKYLQHSYELNKYRGYTLYLNLVEQIKGLKNPDPTDVDDDVNSQSHLKIKEIKPPQNCEIYWNTILGFLQNQDEEEVAENLLQIKVLDEIFFQKVQPHIYAFLPEVESKFLIFNAPENVKLIVSKLFYNLKENTPSGNQALEKLIQDIFVKDVTYFNELNEYLSKKYPNIANVKQSQSYQQVYMQSCFKIKQLFVKKSSQIIYNIQDFMTIDPMFDNHTTEIQIINLYRKENKLFVEDICILLFDFIKRRQNFSSLINLISKQLDDDQKQIDCHLTKSTLFNLLMKNSDTYLRTLILMACCKFMPVPLISYDWENQKVLIWKELFYSFEKRRAIFNYKLSTNKQQGPRGCSTLANQLFNKDFEQHTNMLTNYGSIDIQFDYNFACPLYVPVADAHGYLDLVILRKVYCLFDIFIIHIVKREEDRRQMNEEINQIFSVNKESLVIVLEHDSEYEGDLYNLQKVNEKLYIFKSKPHDQLIHQVKINLRDQIFQLVMLKISLNDKYLEDVDQRIQSQVQFTVLLQNFEIDNSQAKNAIEIAKNFMSLVLKNSNNLHTKEFLPHNFTFARRCQIYNQLLESEICNDQREKLNKELDKEDKNLKECSEAPILKLLQKIVEQENFVGMSSIIAKALKGYIDGELLHLSQNREHISDELKIKGLNEEQYNHSKIEMQLAIRRIENKRFSIEYVIRELYLLGMNHKYSNEKPYYKMYSELALLQIKQGQPFEIIDGNNLQFISGIYDELYQNIDDTVLVVSVIGPQSSGKSLLLNFLFGTQFVSSAGRCTKGVYGTIIELKSSNQQTYKKILLLDTEGIQATEGRNEKFDKRIVFFIFCVSHVVLICNKGEMNNQMAEVIKIAADALSSLKADRVQGMSVNIIMNMLAEINQTALQACITQLSDSIMEMNNDSILISKNNVFMLPFAFDSHGQDKMKVNQPSVNFQQSLEPLRKKILDKTYNIDPSRQSIYTINEWFDYANKFWTFTQSFNGVFDYKNLEQKRDDVKLTEKINSLIEEFFQSKQKDYKVEIDQILVKIMKPHEGLVETNIQTLSSTILEQLLQKYQQIKSKIQTDLLRYCEQQNISISLREKRQNFLLRRMNYYLTEWKNIANIQLALFTQKKAKKIGDQRLQTYISKYMAQQETFSDQEAAQKFQEAWQLVEKSIVSMLKTRTQVADEIFSLVHGYFENEIVENSFKNLMQEHKQLKQYQQTGVPSLCQFFVGQQEQFFFFTGHQIKPDPKKFIAQQGRAKKFLVNSRHKLLTQSLHNMQSNQIKLIPQQNQIKSQSEILQARQAQLSKKDNIEFDESVLKDEPYIQRYFKFLQNPAEIPVNQNSKESEKAKQYFFNQLNHQNIVRAIEIIVLQNYQRDGKIGDDTVEDWLIRIRTDKTQKQRKKFCKIDRKIIQNVILNIKELLSQIDEELEPFCFKITDHGSHSLHLIGQTFINALAEEIEFNEQSTPLQIWQDSQQIEKNMFIAKLTSNDSATDIAIAEKTALAILDMIVQRANDDVMYKFQKNILLIKKEFDKNATIQRLEDFAIRAAYMCGTDIEISQLNNKEIVNLEKEFGFTSSEIVSFYVEPKEFLQKKFLSEWGEQTNRLLNESKKKYILEINENKGCVINFFDSLKKMLKKTNSDLTSLQLFINQNQLHEQKRKTDPKMMQFDQNYDHPNQAAAHYLIMMLTGKWKQNQKIQLRDDLIYVCHPNVILPLPQDVINPPNNQIVDEIIAHLQDERISKLYNYIDQLVQYLIENKENDLQDVEIIGNIMQDYKNTFVGCNEYCPLCRRECDLVHDEADLLEERIHQCIGGHQLQCFGGSRYSYSNEAVTIGCNDIKDIEDIIYKEKKMKWFEFKKTFPQWKFDVSQERLLISSKKNTIIWNSLGPKICEYYNKKGIDIKFVPTTHIPSLGAIGKVVNRIHYILLLDRSSSMSGKRWQDLLIAVNNFLKILEASQNLRENCRVSIIGHDHDSQEVCYNSIPSTKLVELIKFTGGNNDFNKPLWMALKFMEKSFDNFDKFVVCFMSDGACSYPSAAIKEIIESRVMCKIDFRGIGYGGDPEIKTVMEPMSKALHGKMVYEVKAEALSQAFIGIIINQYQD